MLSHRLFKHMASRLTICMWARLKENIGKGAMQHIASSNLSYFSSIASKLEICMGIKMKIIEHFITITKHRIMVMKYCFRVGLYKQGLLHDLSKYSPTEFLVGCKYYQGSRSPNNAEREMIGYSSAWLNHKGRNKHHSEYWVDYGIGKEPLIAIKMPKKYVVEMLMDRISASRVYEGEKYTCRSPLNYYQRGRGVVIMHEETQEMLELLLRKLADEGEEEVIRFVKYEFLKEKSKGAREITGMGINND